ncbi:hypothetical protein [Clostridium butyricum]|uniref:hypothetical protein n=1 Tax=Clostridium butyricum TaxID=1492 RepID=UPI002AB3191F|nr:hypothetical protein [Clostridium butyricum]
MKKKYLILPIISALLLFNCQVPAVAGTTDTTTTANISSDKDSSNSPRFTWQTVKVDNYFDENEGIWKTNITIKGDHLITKEDLTRISYFINYDTKKE